MNPGGLPERDISKQKNLLRVIYGKSRGKRGSWGLWGRGRKGGRLFLQGEGLVRSRFLAPCLPLPQNISLSERKIYMRCLYREKRYSCGKYLEVDIFPVFEYQRSRGKKRKPTSEVQKRLNRLNAERRLIRLLNTNFTGRDIRFDLTYNSQHLPGSPEEAQRPYAEFSSQD